MKKHILFVGLNDKDTLKQEVETREAMHIVADICGDCTISESLGVYTHDNGETVRETSLRVEMLFKEDTKVLKMAHEIKKALNQESVGMECIESNSVLI